MATLQKVYAPESPAGRQAVIFVHGLGGHPRSTWMCSEDEASLWPVWVGQDAECPVWTLAYDAALSGWIDGAMPLPDQGGTVLDLLSAEESLDGQPLVLIGHSLGGLVIKTAVVHAATTGTPRYERLLDHLRAVIFIATPHLGSDLANLALAMRSLLRTNEQVGDLTQHSAQLRTLGAQFRNVQVRRGFQVRTFAESRGVFVGRRIFGLPIGRRIQVVATGNADPVAGDEVVLLPEDHFSICKPRDRDAQIHKSVLELLRDVSTQRKPAQHTLPPADHASAPASTPSQQVGPPGLLRGPDDKRLRPREGSVYGRTAEIARLMAFLESTDPVICIQVTGAGGVGKTEVCKAALREWMRRNSAVDAYYVEIPDGASATAIPYRIGVALGAGNVSTFEELRPLLRNGLYYLDNIESAAENIEGQSAIRSLKEHPGVLVLSSSRVSLPLVFDRDLSLDALEPADAETLFRDLWSGDDPLPAHAQTNAVGRFVEKELGCHALTISLVARLGDTYPFARIVERWRDLGSAMASDPANATRLGNLDKSMKLTSESLAADEGALDLWTLAALSPSGVPERAVSFFVGKAGWPERARQQLTRHHIWLRDGDRYRMLPPLARHALDRAQRESDGFSWLRVRKLAFPYFQELAEAAASIKSSDAVLAARARLLDEFTSLSRLVTLEARHPSPNKDELGALDASLENTYPYRIALSVEMLRAALPILTRPARAIKSLGDLERRLGRVDHARALFDRALSLYESEQDGLGQASTLLSLGDLERNVDRKAQARKLYDRALELFESEQDELGQANTLKSLGDLERLQDRFDPARALYERALVLYEREQSELGQANTLHRLGYLESLLGGADQARGLYKRSLVLFERQQEELGQANTLQGLGDLLRSSGHSEQALESYRQALAFYEKVQDPFGAAYTWAECARCFHALGHQEEAQAALLTAHRFSRASNAPSVDAYVREAAVDVLGGEAEADQWLLDFGP